MLNTRFDKKMRPTTSPIEIEALYREFAPLVRRLIGRYATTTELRRDLPGEIYRRFCDLLNDYDLQQGVPFRPYMVRQLTAAAYDTTRQYQRNLVRELGREAIEWDIDLDREDDPVATCLIEAIDLLPPRQRQVVIWRYYEERSFEEIAALLGVETATVSALLWDGMARLRAHIAPPASHGAAD